MPCTGYDICRTNGDNLELFRRQQCMRRIENGISRNQLSMDATTLSSNTSFRKWDDAPSSSSS